MPPQPGLLLFSEHFFTEPDQQQRQPENSHKYAKTGQPRQSNDPPDRFVEYTELRYMSHIPAYQFHIFESGNIPNRSAHWPAPSGRLPGLRLPVFDHPSL